MRSHEIDYKIYGNDVQYVEIELDPQETVIAEAGNLMMMENEIKMETVFGDPSQENQGFMNKLLGAGKRLVTGESLFMTTFTNIAPGIEKRKVYFAAPYPGQIIPVDLSQFGGKFICQKDAFLCAAKGVTIGIHFQKKIGAGIFGGEGFVMQKIEGDGMAFIHAGGSIHEVELKPGQVLKIDTGCLVAMSQEVDFDIQFVGGVKNALFGGEGIFFATVRGPGSVLVQSLPFNRLADRIISASKGGKGPKEEGSIIKGAMDLFQ
jgi:uncharacterized protein (TIGR00266 family)